MPTFVHVIVIITCALFGLTIGVLSFMFIKLGAFLIGAWIGASFGLMFYNGVISPILGSTGGSTLFIIFVIVCIIAGGIVTCFFFK